jgi:hypothetical protein
MLADNVFKGRIGRRVVFGHISSKHEASSIETIHEPHAPLDLDLSKKMPRKIAALDIKPESMPEKTIQTAEADGVS